MDYPMIVSGSQPSPLPQQKFVYLPVYDHGSPSQNQVLPTTLPYPAPQKIVLYNTPSISVVQQQQEQPVMIKKRKDRTRSCFRKFFILQEGVISLSLRDLTLIGCLAITFSLLVMLYQSCKNQYVECSYDLLPMISDVICLPFYDRIFCLVTVFFTFTAYQVDCRAFYSRLNGIATACENDTLLVLGIITTISLPAIGFFDEHTYPTIHIIVAGCIFGSIGIYAFIIGGIMQKNVLQFPKESWAEIAIMNKLKWVMLACLLVFWYSAQFHGANYWLTPVTEWLTFILYVNFFSILSFTNQYYDSVHPFDSTNNGVSKKGAIKA